MEPFRYTEKEAAMVAKLAQVRIAADAGDKRAKRKIAQVEKQLKALRKKAERGNLKAARAARVLEESGLLNPSQVFAMEGWDPRGWKLGGLNVFNLALFATTGVLLLKKKWTWSAAPMVVLLANEGHQKGWW